MVRFCNDRAFINPPDARAFLQKNSPFFFHKGAREMRDQGAGRAGITLLMIRLWQLEDVSSIFDEGMLKSAACAEKRNLHVASKTDCLERSLHACVRARRNTPEALKTG